MGLSTALILLFLVLLGPVHSVKTLRSGTRRLVNDKNAKKIGVGGRGAAAGSVGDRTPVGPPVGSAPSIWVGANTPVTPSLRPSSTPSSNSPSSNPSHAPTVNSSFGPSDVASESPSLETSSNPSHAPTVSGSFGPSDVASESPSLETSSNPSHTPTVSGSFGPSDVASESPSLEPSSNPSHAPTVSVSFGPSDVASESPSSEPSSYPPSSSTSSSPSSMPSTSSMPSASSMPSVSLYPGCNTQWLGFGLGMKPQKDIPDLPDGMSPGECLVTAHCAGAVSGVQGETVCCLKDFCLCGPPNADKSNCRT